jgi:TonB family protein
MAKRAPEIAENQAPCPFCGRGVDQNMIVFGGKCPHCFGEIPGEEAATDPGEEKRKAEQKATAAKVQRTSRVPMLLAALVVLIPMVAAMVFVLRPQKEMPVLDLDDAEYDMAEIGTMVAWVEPKAQPDVSTKSKKSISKTPSTGSTGPDGSEGTAEGTGSDAVASAAGASSEGTAEPGRSTGGSKKAAYSGSGLDVDISVQRRKQTGVVLKDDSAIIEMIKSVVGTELPKLRWQCYERRLKTDESVRGSWTVNFTVQPDGSVAEVSVVPKENGDRELETCVAEKVKSWSFQPIKQAQPVSKSVVFRPS